MPVKSTIAFAAMSFACWLAVPSSMGTAIGRADPPSQAGGGAIPNPDTATIADFQARVKEYVGLHKQLEGTLPRLSDSAGVEERDEHGRALGALVDHARSTARPGDLFAPAMQNLVRRRLLRIFAAPEGKQIRSSIMDENPLTRILRVNQRYPDGSPVSTMPPEVLAALPPLDKVLQYRFVADQLILLDVPAQVVLDYVEHAFPRN